MERNRKYRTAELRALGMTKYAIAAAVRAGRLLVVRRGQYASVDCSEVAVLAGRLGGRVDCVSLLRELGIFVRASSELHIQMTPHSSRQPRTPKGVIRHWRTSDSGRDALAVTVEEALAQAVRCQAPRDAVATLDSALHEGLVGEGQLEDVFALLPARHAFLRRMVDRRSESGPETLVRLRARSLGFDVQVQVEFDGIGRVDLVLDGWLVVECDSRAHHSSWEQQLKDYRRDLALAARGYCVLRLTAEDIMYRPEAVMKALAGLRRR